MENVKPKFFKRLKNAIFNFDEYKVFADEKVSVCIKYLLKFMILFSILITTVLTIKVVQIVNNVKSTFIEQCPTFYFEGTDLIIEGESKKIITGYPGEFGFIINPEVSNIEEVQEANDYSRYIAFLKDKVVITDADGVHQSVLYSTLSKDTNLNNINKQTIVDALSGKVMNMLYVLFVVISVVYLFIIFLIQIVFDILILSLIGLLMSRIIGIKLKYSSLFNISAYASSLSLILYALYIIMNISIGFRLVYFDVGYRAISYIYLITALFIIKSDLIKQNMELNQIVKTQEEVKNEAQEEDEQKEDVDKEDSKKENKDEKKNKEKNSDKEPEGNQA